MSRKIKDYFVFGMPTIDETADFYTLGILHDVNQFMQKSKIAISCSKLGIVQARHQILLNLKSTLNHNQIEYDTYIRMLWIDNDIRIQESSETLANRFVESDKDNKNLIANYKNTWTGGRIINTLAIPDENNKVNSVGEEQLKNLKDNDILPTGSTGGLGFYYGSVPIDYIFHNETFGEDITFFRDMYKNDKNYRLTYSDAAIKHKKEILI